MNPSYWFFVGLIVGSPLAIVWHELGHAIAALLLDIPLREFSGGEGRRKLEVKLGDVRVLGAARINRGHVRVDLPTGRAARRRYAAMIAAGPAANAGMLLLVFF